MCELRGANQSQPTAEQLGSLASAGLASATATMEAPPRLSPSFAGARLMAICMPLGMLVGPPSPSPDYRA